MIFSLCPRGDSTGEVLRWHLYGDYHRKASKPEAFSLLPLFFRQAVHTADAAHLFV